MKIYPLASLLCIGVSVWNIGRDIESAHNITPLVYLAPAHHLRHILS